MTKGIERLTKLCKITAKPKIKFAFNEKLSLWYGEALFDGNTFSIDIVKLYLLQLFRISI